VASCASPAARLLAGIARNNDDQNMALDLPCPHCGSQMYPEQAHNRCPACLYIEPCCDGAPQPCRVPVNVE